MDRRLMHTFALMMMAATGCASSSGDPEKPLPRVPASGVIRLDGQPLAGAVVVFNPLEERGTLTQGETDAEGRYELKYVNMPGGTSPGRYGVAVSYLVSPGGEPQGLGPRSALMRSPEFSAAAELLPQKYSDLTRTELEAVVPPEGNTSLDFDLEGPLLDPPPPIEESAEPAEESAEPTEESAEPTESTDSGEPAEPAEALPPDAPAPAGGPEAASP